MTNMTKNQHFRSKERKFTIIIPTRDRADTLAYALTSATKQDYTNLEIIVSDNASQDNTFNIVKSMNDSRVRYINTGRRVSMSHNWEFAISHVDEGWVTVLGDDDAILPGALKTVNQIIDSTGTQAIRSNGCDYAWPTLRNTKYGRMSLSLRRGYKRVRSADALCQVMSGTLRYINLPVLYNGGFIDFSLVKKAKSITGSFFLSMTPDTYSGIVFSFLTEEYIYSHEPLAINGGSHHSGGTAAFSGLKTKRSYDPAEKFFSEENIPFHPSLPLTKKGTPVKSIQAIVYEAYLQAAAFHSIKPMVNDLVSPQQQLDIVLKDLSLYPHTIEEVMQWAPQFAKQNDFVFNSLRKPNFNAIIVRRYLMNIPHFLTTAIVTGKENLELNNVYEASIVAESIKKTFFRKFSLLLLSWIVRLSELLKRLT